MLENNLFFTSLLIHHSGRYIRQDHTGIVHVQEALHFHLPNALIGPYLVFYEINSYRHALSLNSIFYYFPKNDASSSIIRVINSGG